MLENLYIKDFILIDELNIDINKGFSVFTGETGAGKSIFIDAISILTGDRLTTSQIRTNCQKAIIEGIFSVTDELKYKLEEAGYDSDTLIVTREINLDGKSVTRINQRNTTVSFLKECFQDYIDIHCQHDNQYLLNEKYHLSLLDSYCKNDEDLNLLKNKYDSYKALNDEFNKLKDSDFNEDQLDLLKFQANEIESLNIHIGEDDEIDEIIKNYSQIEKIKVISNRLRDLIEDKVLSNLYDATKELDQIRSQSKLEKNINSLCDSYYSIQDDYESIIDYLDSINDESIDIDSLNQRLYDIQRLKRKHNTNIEGLLNKISEMKQQIDNYSNREFVLNELEKKIAQSLDEYTTIASLISNNRKNIAKKLEIEVMNQLKDLNLEKAIFNVKFEEIKPSLKGIDQVSFYVTMNPGQPLQPLSKTASGGELSRLMLGLKTIFARLAKTSLVIFDEIDTGVSGLVAFNMGIKMHKISKDMQVFSVTHLAAVAAHGDSHYKIIKKQGNDSTHTEIKQLNNEERIEELALLSSSSISDNSLAAAKELFDKAQLLEYRI